LIASIYREEKRNIVSFDPFLPPKISKSI